jgi:hypothetical protein
MTTCDTVYRVAGDTGPDLYSELEGINLTGKSISLTVRYEAGGELNKDAVVDDAEAGTFHFVWEANDLVVGRHRMEFVIVDGSSVTRLPSRDTLALIVRSQV